MICPNCKASLSKTNKDGDELIRSKGMVIKSHGLVCICPKCKADVSLSPDLAQKIHNKMVLFFQKK